jgi:hypothetical protein
MLEGGALVKDQSNDIGAEDGKDRLAVVSFEEFDEAARSVRMSAGTAAECKKSGMNKFEGHDGFDLILLNIPDDSICSGRTGGSASI